MRSLTPGLRGLLLLALLGLCASCTLAASLPLFALPVNYLVNAAPTLMVAGDFNQDGAMDLITTHLGSRQLVLLPGKGDGTFDTKQIITLLKTPYGIVTADLNNDTVLDLAVANMDNDSVSVLLGKGDGSFQTGVDYPAGVHPRGITAADFNNDGALDLVVTNYQTENATAALLLNTGDGTFSAKSDIITGRKPSSVADGDFNRDGYRDLVVANYQDNSISILLGQGDGTFREKLDYLYFSQSPSLVCVSDFNADGCADVAVATTNGVEIRTGNGDGTFDLTRRGFSLGTASYGFAIADMNGDNLYDIACAGYGTGTVGTKISYGDASFDISYNYVVGDQPYAVVIRDFNGDGRPDIAVTLSGSGAVAVLLNSPPPEWSTGYPKVRQLDTSAQLLIKLHCIGHAYAVCLPYGANAPSSEQVKVGTNAADQVVALNFKGSVDMTIDTEASIPVTDLVEGVSYDCYIVSEDDNGKLQNAPTKRSFSFHGDALDVARDLDALAITYAPGDDATRVTQLLTLPVAGINGSTISWASSLSTTVSTRGLVVRPSFTVGDQSVTLTATAKKGTESGTKTFALTVLKLPITDPEVVALDLAALAIGYADGDSATSVTQALTLPGSGEHGAVITWASTVPETVSATGVVTRPTFTAGNRSVILTATISNGTVSSKKPFPVLVFKLPISDAEVVAADTAALAIGYAPGDSAAHVTQALALPSSGTNGAVITWASTVPATISASGVVSRPAFLSGDQAITLTATVSHGAVSSEKIFAVTVLKLPITEAEIVAYDTAALAIGYATGDSATSVKKALTLPTRGVRGSTITWTSSVPATVTSAGVVTRPAYPADDQAVTVTATVSKGAASTEKAFAVTVIKLPLPDAQAVTLDLAAVAIGYAPGDTAASVTQAVMLPRAGEHGTTISWTSSMPTRLSVTGVVNRPPFVASDLPVILVARVVKGQESAVHSFTLTVCKQPPTPAEAVAADKAALAVGYAPGDSAPSVTRALALPTTGVNGSTITWTSSAPATISANGLVTRPTYAVGDVPVRLTALITHETAMADATFALTVITLPCMDADAVLLDQAALAIGYAPGDSATAVTRSLTLPTRGPNGTAITWTSSVPATITTTGGVTRPAFPTGDRVVRLTATVSKGAVASTKDFALTVSKLPITDADAVLLDRAALAIGYAPGDSATSVTQTLTLPKAGEHGTTISWTSSVPARISPTGTVSRLLYGVGDITVTLTARITKSSASATQGFVLTVRKLPPSERELVAQDLAALDIRYAGDDNAAHVTQGLGLPVRGANGTTISWQSSAAKTISVTGQVTRPSFTAGNATVTLTATVRHGRASAGKSFRLTVLKLPPNDAQAVAAALKTVAIGYASGDSAVRVTQALTLPTMGEYGVSIRWQSSLISVITPTGAVTRPSYGAVNARMVLTATVSRGTVALDKAFTITVIKLPRPS
ncbi:MAG TPA: VCBS repeat-containing protein [Armatimonadota bacterium]|jgi:hypothetical protein